MVPIIRWAFVKSILFPIFIDESALQLETMIVSAGEIGHSIQIKPQLLADFVKGDFADILE